MSGAKVTNETLANIRKAIVDTFKDINERVEALDTFGTLARFVISKQFDKFFYWHEFAREHQNGIDHKLLKLFYDFAGEDVELNEFKEAIKTAKVDSNYI